MNASEFERWGDWLEEQARTLREAGQAADLRRDLQPSSKPCCSFRIETDRALGQFSIWVTGEADFDIMDAQTREFAHCVWGMVLDNVSFETAFGDFLSRVTHHPTQGRSIPASMQSAWFAAKSIF